LCQQESDHRRKRSWHHPPGNSGAVAPEKNGTLTPQSVVYGNYRKVWWRCEKGHEWQATILSRTWGGNGCPVCAGKKILPGENDLASQNPKIAAQWHPTKNGLLTPQKVTLYSNRRVWWICEKGHEYRMGVNERSSRGSKCPYCQNHKALEGFNDLATLEPAVAAQWHPELNGNLTPKMVVPGSHKKVWWQCNDGHVWQATVYSRTGHMKCGCPVCAGKIKKNKQRRYDKIVAEPAPVEQPTNPYL